MIGVIRVAVFARDDHGTDFGRRVNRLHLVKVILEPARVGVGIVRARAVIGFPRAVILVANLPILEVVTLCDIAVADPVGGLGGRARTVIDRDEDLRGRGGGNVRKLVE